MSRIRFLCVLGALLLASLGLVFLAGGPGWISGAVPGRSPSLSASERPSARIQESIRQVSSEGFYGAEQTSTGADEGPEPSDDPLGALSQRLYVDRITRESKPNEYPEVILGLARAALEKSMAADLDSRAATFAGFKSWVSLTTALERLDEGDGETASLLRGLMEKSVNASYEAQARAVSALHDQLSLQVWNAEQPTSRGLWVGHDFGELSGLYAFETATRVGDRVFTLHFDSSLYPGLEVMLQDLMRAKDSFWAAYKERQ